MERIKPSAGLIDPFGDEVGRIDLRELIFGDMRIENLSKGHRSRIEPYVDQVRFAMHGFAAVRHQYDLVDIRTMKVYFIKFLFRGGIQPEPFPRNFRHDPGLNGFSHFFKQFFERADAFLFLPVLGAPYG